jgi:hypothetical protein
MGDQLEAIAAAGDPISVCPLIPAHRRSDSRRSGIADPLTRQSIRQIRLRGWTKPFWGTHETALKQSGRKAFM